MQIRNASSQIVNTSACNSGLVPGPENHKMSERGDNVTFKHDSHGHSQVTLLT